MTACPCAIENTATSARSALTASWPISSSSSLRRRRSNSRARAPVSFSPRCSVVRFAGLLRPDDFGGAALPCPAAQRRLLPSDQRFEAALGLRRRPGSQLAQLL